MVPRLSKAVLLTLVITGTLFGGLGGLTKRWEKSGLIVSGALVLFFFYGHVHEYLFIQHRISLGRHRYLLVLWGIGFSLLLMGVWRSVVSVRRFTAAANWIAICLILGALANLTARAYTYSTAASALPETSESKLQSPHTVAAKDSYPDIYYIILDGYARQDTLAELYGYPANDLVSYLKEKGFYIASQSAANYAHTFLSLASSLNMTHLHSLSQNPGQDSAIRKIPGQMIENNEVVRFLKKQGYTYVHYNSGYEVTLDSRLADVRIDCYPNSQNNTLSLLLTTTLLSAIEPRFPYHWFYSNREESEKKLCLFSKIGTTLSIRSPKFVFMHVMLPHPPFLFKQDGSVYGDSFSLAADKWGAREKYKDQLIFLNQKVKAMVGETLTQSKRPPVIIIQSDHGPASALDFDHPSEVGIKERMKIFNAYLLPDGKAEKLYETISPINSFRLVFNSYFGTNLKVEEDRSYFSSWQHPYRFSDVTSVLSQTLN